MRSKPPQLASIAAVKEPSPLSVHQNKLNSISTSNSLLPALPKSKISRENLEELKTDSDESGDSSQKKSEEVKTEKEEEKEESGGSEEEGNSLEGLSKEEIKELAVRAFYTSTTLRMTQEACLPVPRVT